MKAVVLVGDERSLQQVFTKEDLATFARLSGDANPLHADALFAHKTRSGGVIAQGMFVASLISAVIGARPPGPGNIYLSQTLKFQWPHLPGRLRYWALNRVSEVRKEGRMAVLETWCENEERVR